jgi:hypothetical protein
MTEVKLNDKTTITLYSTIKELPIENSKKFNNYLLQDAGIGNTIEDVDDHLARLMVFLSEKKTPEALEEVKNLRYNLFSMISNWDYESMSFACLIKDVNGEPVTDYSSEGIITLMARLSEQGLNNEKVADVIEEVKKNLIPNVSYISPSSLQPI